MIQLVVLTMWTVFYETYFRPLSFEFTSFYCRRYCIFNVLSCVTVTKKEPVEQ